MILCCCSGGGSTHPLAGCCSAVPASVSFTLLTISTPSCWFASDTLIYGTTPSALIPAFGSSVGWWGSVRTCSIYTYAYRLYCGTGVVYLQAYAAYTSSGALAFISSGTQWQLGLGGNVCWNLPTVTAQDATFALTVTGTLS